MPNLSFFNPLSSTSYLFATSGYQKKYKLNFPTPYGEEPFDISMFPNELGFQDYATSLLKDKNTSSFLLSWQLLLGNHYLFKPQIDRNTLNTTVLNGGAKGLLDFLIFPLLSRAIYQAAVDNPDYELFSTLPRMIWGVLEAARLALAVALVAPVALVLALVRFYQVEANNEYNDTIQSSLAL